ncbi:hypothetical protein [Owenweeksia hongkongensis]|uniref:hypothetical protein n=1 Tax=Owenweeksia hongkongensis TaxID=253245 RepID=UPI003A8FFB67
MKTAMILNFLFDDAEWQGPDTYCTRIRTQASYQIFNWADVTAKYEGAYTRLNDSENCFYPINSCSD